MFKNKEDIMNLNEFAERLQNDVRRRLPEKYVDLEIQITDHSKLNESYKGLMIRNENGICPVINVEAFYTNWTNGKPYGVVVNEVVDAVIRAVNEIPDISTNLIPTKESLEENVYMQLVETEKNKELLSQTPHREIEDLSLVYRVEVKMSGNEKGSFVISNEILEKSGLSEEELYEIAMENSPRNMPVKIAPITAMIEDMLDEEDFLEIPQSPMYVVSNEAAIHGASALFYPGVFDRCSDIMNGNFFVIPSSIHETIIIPNDNSHDISDLKQMVKEVNDTQLLPSEKLSYNVYHYDHKDKVFELAEKYQERMKAKEKQSVLGNLDAKKSEILGGNSLKRTPDIGSRKYQGASL